MKDAETAQVLLIDKPIGITSFDVIRRLRKKMGVRKMGHAGTLDPMASGLMIVACGSATKSLAGYITLPKSYEAEIILGEKRTTGDCEGAITETMPVTDISEAAIIETVRGMVGAHSLPVPAYSAIKQGGEALYKKARRGEVVELPIKLMEVHATKYRKGERHGLRLHVFVSFEVASGTYIRSLAEEFGTRLGMPATLGNLRRTSIGNFIVANAQPLPRQ